MSEQLPSGWAVAALQDIADINPRHPKGLEDSLLVSFAPMATLSEINPDFKALEYRPLGKVRKGFTHFADGDVLFAKITPCMENGKGAVATGLRNGIGCGTTELHVIRPLAGIDPYYLYHFLAQPSVRCNAKEHFTGTAGQARVPTEFIETLQIPLAPIPEQRRIVAKLQNLLGQVDSCQKRLGRIPLLLKRFRQSVLSAACCGQLTFDWRKRRGNAKNARECIGNLSTPEPEDYLDTFERSSIGDIPDTWTWVKIGKLGKFVGGGTPSKENPSYWGGDVPWVSPKDMKVERISKSEDHITQSAIQHSSTKMIPKGSILFVVRGMILIHTLPTAITDVSITMNQDMKALIPENSKMSEYLALAARHIAPNILFEVKEATHGTRRIESDLLKNWAIPIPPIDEQIEIVRLVNHLFFFSAQIETRFDKAKSQINKLSSSILAKAFRGELVSQALKDEPASVLLQRIGDNSKSNGSPPKKRAPVKASSRA